MNDILLLGGYAPLNTAQIWNLCHYASEKKLSLAALRVYLACSEMIERRCKVEKTPFYGVGEITKLTGLKERTVNNGLRELTKHGLLEFSEENVKILPQSTFDFEQQPFDTDPNRIVPIPRRLLRILASHTSKNQIIVTLIHCARGLFLLGKKLVMKGAVKCSWIEAVFSIGRTTIVATRAWLRSIGFIKEQDGVEQWRKNRFGYYFQVLCGQLPKRKKRETPKNAQTDTPYKRIPFNKLKLNNTSTRVRTKQTQPFHSGFFKKKSFFGPDIRDIQTEDLKRISTLRVLFKQATAKGWLPNSQSAFQNFVGAAVRALNVGKNPPAFFSRLVRTPEYWKHITHAEEERAVSAIKRYRAKQEGRGTKKETRQEKLTELIAGTLKPIPKTYIPCEDY